MGITQDNEWLTVADAARVLGVSKQAVRQRIYRDSIPHTKDEKGTVYVRITEHNQDANDETLAESPGVIEPVMRELLGELRDRIGFLERQLENEQRAHAETRRIVAGLVQRVPELEPASGPREAPISPSEGPGNTQVPSEEERPSWWQRFFSRRE